VVVVMEENLLVVLEQQTLEEVLEDHQILQVVDQAVKEL
jgi:uncharacterized membrane protein